jgi:hypothetical protein
VVAIVGMPSLDDIPEAGTQPGYHPTNNLDYWRREEEAITDSTKVEPGRFVRFNRV